MTRALKNDSRYQFVLGIVLVLIVGIRSELFYSVEFGLAQTGAEEVCFDNIDNDGDELVDDADLLDCARAELRVISIFKNGTEVSKSNPADIEIIVTGANARPNNFSTVDAQRPGMITEINGRHYTVKQSPVSGYVTTYSQDCYNFAGLVQSNQKITCLITNTLGSTLKVRTLVLGGYAVPEDLRWEVKNNSSRPVRDATGFFEVNASSSTDGSKVTIYPGSYSVAYPSAHMIKTPSKVQLTSSIKPPEGYTTTYSPDCEGNISVMETRVCTTTLTFTNDEIASVHIDTSVNGGPAKVEDFLLDFSSDGKYPFHREILGLNAVDVKVTPGHYEVEAVKFPFPSESKFSNKYTYPVGYESVYSDGCVSEINANESKNCIITNNYIGTGSLKLLVNTTGGNFPSTHFQINVFSVTTPVSKVPSYSGINTARGETAYSLSMTGITNENVTLTVGAYEVAVSQQAGYNPILSPNCKGTIAAGEIKECKVNYVFKG